MDPSVFPAPMSGGIASEHTSIYAVAERASDLILGDRKRSMPRRRLI